MPCRCSRNKCRHSCWIVPVFGGWPTGQVMHEQYVLVVDAEAKCLSELMTCGLKLPSPCSHLIDQRIPTTRELIVSAALRPPALEVLFEDRLELLLEGQ